MELRVNGESRELKDGATLAELLAEFGVDEEATGVAVAVNDTVVPRQVWPTMVLRGGESIEIVHAVQGG